MSVQCPHVYPGFESLLSAGWLPFRPCCVITVLHALGTHVLKKEIFKSRFSSSPIILTNTISARQYSSPPPRAWLVFVFLRNLYYISTNVLYSIFGRREPLIAVEYLKLCGKKKTQKVIHKLQLKFCDLYFPSSFEGYTHIQTFY